MSEASGWLRLFTASVRRALRDARISSAAKTLSDQSRAASRSRFETKTAQLAAELGRQNPLVGR